MSNNEKLTNFNYGTMHKRAKTSRPDIAILRKGCLQSSPLQASGNLEFRRTPTLP